ncbi:AAA family ATPase [Pseudomonas sp. 2822-15]|uniref:AAA family ATPase n=1 Tax=Pseudomonas sp. 2822-15 TaxID=1712677 RepID=UPI001179E970
MKNHSILLISGPLAVGKTSIREVLVNKYGYTALQSSAYLRKLAASQGIPIERSTLQVLGDRLDLQTQYQWIVIDVALPQIQANPSQCLWIVDAVRKEEQVKLFREHFGSAVKHVHFNCAESLLKNRYETRNRQDDSAEYEVAISHPNEIASRNLSLIADWTIDVDNLTSESAADMVKKLVGATTH